MSLLLTQEELTELTGYKQPSKQLMHLRAQRIPFFTNRAGHPKVARAALEGKKAPEIKQTWTPSWAENLR
jgi:Tol biopolymer transport system component